MNGEWSTANFSNMENSFEEIHKLREKAEASMDKTSKILQSLAKLEAALSRKEDQKVIEKSQNI